LLPFSSPRNSARPHTSLNHIFLFLSGPAPGNQSCHPPWLASSPSAPSPGPPPRLLPPRRGNHTELTDPAELHLIVFSDRAPLSNPTALPPLVADPFPMSALARDTTHLTPRNTSSSLRKITSRAPPCAATYRRALRLGRACRVGRLCSWAASWATTWILHGFSGSGAVADCVTPYCRSVIG
jgi:hypothetical protein